MKIIIYDNTCPMCNLYTKAFVDNGILEHDGRLSFEEVEAQYPEFLQQIDHQRGRHEIPLIDTDSEQSTIYGYDALIYVLSARFAIVRLGAGLKPIDRFFRLLYKFISYNRRVIAPSKRSHNRWAPDFDLFWRSVYLVFALLVSGLALSPAGGYAISAWAAVNAIQGLYGLSMPIQSRMEYYGQWLSAVLMFSLLLCPFVVVGGSIAIVAAIVLGIGLCVEFYRRLSIVFSSKSTI